MGLRISIKPRDVFRRGGWELQLLGGIARDFNNPGIEGLSADEEREIARQRQTQEDRRSRLAWSMYSRGRVAMGAEGGNRTLLMNQGGFVGAQRELGAKTPLGGF